MFGVEPSRKLRIKEKLRRQCPSLTEDEADDLVLDFDLSFFWLLRWADSRADETVTVPAPSPPRTAGHTKQVPAYPTLVELLMLDEEQVPTMTEADVRELATDILSDPERLARLLAGEDI